MLLLDGNQAEKTTDADESNDAAKEVCGVALLGCTCNICTRAFRDIKSVTCLRVWRLQPDRNLNGQSHSSSLKPTISQTLRHHNSARAPAMQRPRSIRTGLVLLVDGASCAALPLTSVSSLRPRPPFQSYQLPIRLLGPFIGRLMDRFLPSVRSLSREVYDEANRDNRVNSKHF